MIVNPQLFNYRLIIGTLVIAIVVLGSYSFSNYQTLKNHEEFLKMESLLVQNELNEMIKSYDAVKVNSNTIELELADIKTELSTVLDSLSIFNTDVSIISKYKKQVAGLLFEKKRLYAKVNLFEKQHETLQEEFLSMSQRFSEQQTYFDILENENLKLSHEIKKITSVSAKNVNAVALSTISPISDVKTNKIKKLDHIEVCLTLLSNEFTSKGNKNIFVQLIGPDNQLVVERGHVKFKDIAFDYSGMTVVNNTYDNIDVCTKINVESKSKLTEGTYNVIVYNDELEIGKTQIELN
ncbi:hypothetical protein [Bizionia arctica]|uniref:Chromosome partitioning protein ParA n=1 Tax=Bizionia arctica TaxID=1495645 RepID=A0A917LKY6_9FLAO|nr:hypothetical protein [Bizionia arctica]GGG38829.1 hypothetical protein GCM10010976_08260 [Bizionia arctica]